MKCIFSTFLYLLLFPLVLAAQYGNLNYVDFKFGSILIDFDGDGDLDVFPSSSGFPIYWAENLNGDFTYFKYNSIERPTNWTSDDPIMVKTYADFDNDGTIEFLIPIPFEDSALLMRNGTSGIQWSQVSYEYTWKNEPIDIDNDGFLDLVDVPSNGLGFSWYKNLGGNGFSTTISGQLDNVRQRVFVDYDGDGDTDIIDSNSGVHLYLNNGAGQFTAPLLIANEPGGLRAADFDNDGDIDLFFGSSGTFKILENQGSNSFTIAVQKQIPINGSFYVQLNDYDLDGFLDVWFGGEKLYYCKSTGPFSFADAINVQQFSYSSDNLYDLGDLDADGLPDLYFGETNGRWRKNLGNGTFSPDIPLCTNIIHKGIADLDHDGYLDAYGYLKENDINQFGYAKNNGDQAYKWIPIADSLLNPKAVDMNADGLLDIVAGIGRNQIGSFYPKRIEVWLNEGPANFPTKLVLPNKPANWLATLETFTADADGDGDTDIFAYISKSDAITKRNIALMLNDGNGQLTFHAYLSSSDILYLWGAHVHDFDGDGDPDVIFSYTNEVRWMENLGNNNFTPIKMALDLGDLDFGTFYSLADFDNDGVVDIIGGPTTSLNIAYWRSLAGVIDGPHELDAEIEYPYNLTVVDFDLDGDNDIMYAVLDEGLYGDDYYYMYLAENLGNENFAPTDYIDVKYPSGSYYAQEDIDGDSDKDIILFTTGIGDQSQLRWFPNLAEDRFTLRGRTFWDMNGNGTFDVGDYPFTNRKAKLFPQGQLIYANIEGKFLIQGSMGTNHLTTEPDTIWQLTTTPDTFQIDLPKPPNSASEYIFGFEALTDTLLGEAFLQTSSLRCNTTTSQWGGVLNNGTTLMSGTVAYTPDANATLHSFDPLPSSVANGNYFFDFENIPPGSYFVFKMALTMPDVSFLDSAFVFKVQAYVDNPLGLQTDTINHQISGTLRCAFDPNDKLVEPAGIGSHGLLDAAPDIFTYTIRFQNTGNDLAFTVTLKDELHPLLDWNSLRPLAASHPYNVSIDAEGLMEVRFENINLPDSTTNYTGSQGFFMYEIKPRDALPIGSIVTNSAGIYFDFNPPVLTNEVKNLIGYELDVVIMANGSILCDSNALLLNAAIHTTLDSFSYHWEKDGVWVSGDSTLAVNETGQYVIVVNSYGVILTDTIVITQTNDLIASFSTGIDGNEISFFNESVGADSSFWDFGNGQTSNNDSPQLTLLTGVGSLYVCLTVVNTCGTHQNCQHIILSGTAPNAGQMEVLSISPNPTKGLVSLRLALSNEAEIQLSLFDMQGRHAGFDRTLFYNKGMKDVLIDLDSHPAGVYLLRIQVGDTVVWRKIVHQ